MSNAGTKLCEQCGDSFCDTCFEDQHAAGSLQAHTYDEMVSEPRKIPRSTTHAQVPHCQRCNLYAAHKTENGVKGLELCLRCTDCMQKEDANMLCNIPYIPNVIKELLLQREVKSLMDHLGKANQERDFQAQLVAQARLATQIQRT
mmetsp:Transcript_24748/g.74408  ORF Transcript_24748/g.74408 Transcript_24748/m.74408 type:complete len:146 (+) Transcript_24748:2660-3097(+)